MKNFKNAGFERIESMWGEKAVVVLLHACTVKELDKFFVCSKMNPTEFTRLIENLRLVATTEDTQAKVDELEEMYPVVTESTESTTAESDTTTTTEDTTTTTTTESTTTHKVSYKELQAQAKALKEAGLIPDVKLNSNREVLEAAIAQAQAPAPAETTTDTTPEAEITTEETTEDTYYEINFNSKGMQAVIADLDEMYLEAVITKALGRPTKKLIADFDLDPSLKRSEVKAILTEAITALAAYYQDTMEDDEEPTESAPVEEATAEEAPAEEKTETALEVVEVKEVTPVTPKSIIPEGYNWKYVKYSWDGTKEEAIDFALQDIRTMGMRFHDGAAIEEWMLAQVADCTNLATLQSRLEGATWDMMILYGGFHSSINDWLETHHQPIRNDARKDVNYMMSLIWKNTILPDFQEAYPEAWAAVTEEA